jgi:23S rRNA pseudouridine2605 synthase
VARAPRRRRVSGSLARDETPERLQKVLAHAGLASRRQVEQWIRAARLTVNGGPAELGMRVGPSDQVRLDGRLVHWQHPARGAQAYLYHRSSGERLDEPTTNTAEALAALERLPGRAGRRFIVISPMPRIDGGLELICSDGACAAQLQRRVRFWIGVFSVRIIGELGETQRAGVLTGVLDSGERLRVLECRAAGGEDDRPRHRPAHHASPRNAFPFMAHRHGGAGGSAPAACPCRVRPRAPRSRHRKPRAASCPWSG